MYLEQLGEGNEHRVYVFSDNPGIVVKIPKLMAQLEMRLLGQTYLDIQADLARAQKTVASGRIIIPRTKVIKSPKYVYAILQQRILADDSIANPRALLKAEQKPHLLDEYDISPDNFIPSQDYLYWVDPTRGRVGRTLGFLGLYEQARALEARIKRADRLY